MAVVCVGVGIAIMRGGGMAVWCVFRGRGVSHKLK
jgi:hypothetical protein